MNKKFEGPEIRYDAISDDWIVMATSRTKGRKAKIKNKVRKVDSKSKCPFENPKKSGNKDPYFTYPEKANDKNWEIQAFENKYPALSHSKGMVCSEERISDFDSYIKGRGYHDLIITRWHTKNFPDLSKKVATNVLKAFARRYSQISKDKCVKYVSMFQNWGEEAGASVFHPHYQIMSLPVIPNYTKRSLSSSKRYYNKNKKCLYCGIIKKEEKDKKRIVYSNKEAVAFVPFGAREPYQVNIFPKKHYAYFEDTPDKVFSYIADAVQKVLLKIRKNIGDPDYNILIHTSPVYNKKEYKKHYHWYLEIVPKTNIDAGFELSTRMEVNPVLPEEATKRILNKK